jgi:hypothetical protein
MLIFNAPPRAEFQYFDNAVWTDCTREECNQHEHWGREVRFKPGCDMSRDMTAQAQHSALCIGREKGPCNCGADSKQHSVLPWSLDEEVCILYCAAGFVVAASEGFPDEEANARFIMEACNNYERLQALNAQLLEALKLARGPVSYEAKIRYNQHCANYLVTIDAAIAAAEAKP